MLFQDKGDLNTGHGEHWFSELFVSSSFLINSSTALNKKKYYWNYIENKTNGELGGVEDEENWNATKPRLIWWKDPGNFIFLVKAEEKETW